VKHVTVNAHKSLERFHSGYLLCIGTAILPTLHRALRCIVP
jgi:hypothetical protein